MPTVSRNRPCKSKICILLMRHVRAPVSVPAAWAGRVYLCPAEAHRPSDGMSAQGAGSWSASCFASNAKRYQAAGRARASHSFAVRSTRHRWHGGHRRGYDSTPPKAARTRPSREGAPACLPWARISGQGNVLLQRLARAELMGCVDPRCG